MSKHGEALGQLERLGLKEPKEHTGGFVGEKMLTILEGGRYAMARMLDEVFQPGKEDKDLVLQYEVRAQQPIGCGGGYAKLVSTHMGDEESEELTITETTDLSAPEHYSVMFGPDKCAGKNKVHMIVRFQNPVTKEVNEHHMQMPPGMKGQWSSEPSSQLYTMVIRPDDTFKVSINGDTVKEGSLHDEGAFEPPFEPSKTIPDPEDVKPADWVNDAQIPDPSDVKPADWIDEDQIPDPEATKPEDWDDEEDGEWEAPTVPNPDYQGEWKPKMIPNPDYKGEWKPREIPNPAHFEVSAGDVAKSLKVTGILLDLLVHTRDLAFDNFFLGSSESDANKFAELDWMPRFKAQSESIRKAADEARKQAEDDSDSDLDILLQQGTSGMFAWGIQKIIRVGSRNPILVAVFSTVLIVGVMGMCIFSMSSPKPSHGHSHGFEPEETTAPARAATRQVVSEYDEPTKDESNADGDAEDDDGAEEEEGAAEEKGAAEEDGAEEEDAADKDPKE